MGDHNHNEEPSRPWVVDALDPTSLNGHEVDRLGRWVPVLARDLAWALVPPWHASGGAARTRVASAAAAALAGNTRMTYASQWNRFCAWCDRQGVSSHSGRRGLASELGRALKTEFVLQYMSEGAAGIAQGRAAPRPGAGRLLRAAGAHQRPRGLRPALRTTP